MTVLEEDVCAMLLTHPPKQGVSEKKKRMKEKKVSGFLHKQWLTMQAEESFLPRGLRGGYWQRKDSPLETMHC